MPTLEELTAQVEQLTNDNKQLAFQRDDAVGKLTKMQRDVDDLKKKLPNEDERKRLADLEAAAAQAEEERKKKAGEWDSLRQSMADKHAQELAERDGKLSTLSERFKNTVIQAEFGNATDWFGGETAKTIFDPSIGRDALGRYVTVEDVDDDIGYRVVVKHPTTGQVIVGKDGKPAPFAAAIGELISALPNKDRILRGSGKTGSGSSGGSTTTTTNGRHDVSQPIDRGALNDPAVRKQVKSDLAAAGGLQVGRAWDPK